MSNLLPSTAMRFKVNDLVVAYTRTGVVIEVKTDSYVVQHYYIEEGGFFVDSDIAEYDDAEVKFDADTINIPNEKYQAFLVTLRLLDRNKKA
jgi:hypothetical protein